MIRHNIDLEQAVLAVKEAEEQAAREQAKQLLTASHRALGRHIPRIRTESDVENEETEDDTQHTRLK